MNIPDFPWYRALEGIDFSNWPIWVICGVLGVTFIGFIATAIIKVWDL